MLYYFLPPRKMAEDIAASLCDYMDEQCMSRAARALLTSSPIPVLIFFVPEDKFARLKVQLMPYKGEVKFEPSEYYDGRDCLYVTQASIIGDHYDRLVTLFIHQEEEDGGEV